MNWIVGFLITVLTVVGTTGSLINSVPSEQSISTKPDTLYFGFFFDSVTAQSIKYITDSYFNITSERIPEFATFLQNITTNAGLPSIYDYFQKPLDPNTGEYDPLYHVTAKYCGFNQEACDEYEKKNSKYINQTFEMHLTGYVVTNRTFGVRINLTALQKSLFEDDTNYAGQSIGVELTYSHFQQQPQFPRIQLVSQEPFPPPLPPTSSKAHSTLGCGPGIPAVQTGPDLLEAIRLEREAESQLPVVTSWNITDPVDAEGRNMTVTLYKPNSSSQTKNFVFVIYPRVNILANATLMHYFKKPAHRSSSSIPNYYSYREGNQRNSTIQMLATILMNFLTK